MAKPTLKELQKAVKQVADIPCEVDEEGFLLANGVSMVRSAYGRGDNEYELHVRDTKNNKWKSFDAFEDDNCIENAAKCFVDFYNSKTKSSESRKTSRPCSMQKKIESLGKKKEGVRDTLSSKEILQKLVEAGSLDAEELLNDILEEYLSDKDADKIVEKISRWYDIDSILDDASSEFESLSKKNEEAAIGFFEPVFYVADLKGNEISNEYETTDLYEAIDDARELSKENPDTPYTVNSMCNIPVLFNGELFEEMDFSDAHPEFDED